MIEELAQRVDNKKVLLLGVGNRLRGDEGLGCFLVNRLKGKVRIPLVDGGSVPEKQLGLLASSHPDLVLVVVAADVPNTSSGDITLLNLDQLRPMQVKTRSADLSLLFRFIPQKSRPEVIIIAVQPDDEMEGRKGVSNAVQAALDGLEALFVELFG
ncbi:MAG: hydrogenase maturation protease [Chloroflexi bacterium]|nr:hydrogenase maturation protease [Chloroflexota bacterium]